MQAPGSLVDVDIPKLSESPWPGIDNFCSSNGTGAADSEGIRPKPDIEKNWMLHTQTLAMN